MQTEERNLLNSLIEPDELVTRTPYSFQNTKCFHIKTCLDSYHCNLDCGTVLKIRAEKQTRKVTNLSLE